MGLDKISKDSCRTVLDTILLSTMTPGDSKFPSSKEKVLITLTEAVMQYVGKDPAKMGRIYNTDNFEKDVYDRLNTELTKNGNKLNPDIKETIDALTKPQLVNPPRLDPVYYTCELYTIFKEFHQEIGFLFCPPEFFPPEYDWVIRARNELLELPEEKQKDVIEIGKILREIWQKP